MYKVVYRIRASGIVVSKTFESPYLCRRLVIKLYHSKKCELVSSPYFER